MAEAEVEAEEGEGGDEPDAIKKTEIHDCESRRDVDETE